MDVRMVIWESFDEECALYDSKRADLEREHLGEYALIHKDGFVGAYPTIADAQQEAEQRFGQNSYLIYRIIAGHSPFHKGEWQFTNA